MPCTDTEPTRTDSSYRQFGFDVIVRLEFIKLAQEIGFSLKETLGLLNLEQTETLSKTN